MTKEMIFWIVFGIIELISVIAEVCAGIIDSKAYGISYRIGDLLKDIFTGMLLVGIFSIIGFIVDESYKRFLAKPVKYLLRKTNEILNKRIL
jgi:uncharacterized membrane protein